MRLGIFGRGRLGEALAAASATGDSALVWQIGRGQAPDGPVDVAVDASAAAAVPAHLEWALDAGTDLVVAATGWRIDDLDARVAGRIGVVVAPNGSLTVALLARLARLLGAYAATLPDADLYVLDHHHARKADAPSGTALRLVAALAETAARAPSVASLRAGHETGFHVVGLDAPGEQLEVHHRARSRRPFAEGLLAAARWVRGRRGVFTLDDVAAATLDPLFHPQLRTTPGGSR